jgi:hypothetical protein
VPILGSYFAEIGAGEAGPESDLEVLSGRYSGTDEHDQCGGDGQPAQTNVPECHRSNTVQDAAELGFMEFPEDVRDRGMRQMRTGGQAA